jgi:hypothetical protein
MIAVFGADDHRRANFADMDGGWCEGVEGVFGAVGQWEERLSLRDRGCEGLLA